MDLMKFAAQSFIEQLGSNGSGMNLTEVMGALHKLLPTNADGGLDLKSLVAKFSDSGALSGMVESWLGDGENRSLNVDQVLSVFGESQLQSFSQDLSMEPRSAAAGLAGMLPKLIDKSSEGGVLVEQLSGSFGSRIMHGLSSMFGR